MCFFQVFISSAKAETPWLWGNNKHIGGASLSRRGKRKKPQTGEVYGFGCPGEDAERLRAKERESYSTPSGQRQTSEEVITIPRFLMSTSIS